MKLSKILIVIFLCISLLTSPVLASSQVKIIPIQDILFLVPDFDDAPDFNLNQGITQSGSFIGNKKPTKLTPKERWIIASVLYLSRPLVELKKKDVAIIYIYKYI